MSSVVKFSFPTSKLSLLNFMISHFCRLKYVNQSISYYLSAIRLINPSHPISFKIPYKMKYATSRHILPKK